MKYILLVLFSVSLIACSDDPGEYVNRQLKIRIYNSDMDRAEGFPPSADVQDSIVRVRVRMYQNGVAQPQWASEYDYGEPAGLLPQLPFGENYQMVVEALDEGNGIVADGATPLFNYFQDSPMNEIHVFVSEHSAVEYASALFVSDRRVIAAPSEFEGPFLAQSIGRNPEAFGGQRAGHTVTRLPDGRLVVIGGARLSQGGGIGGSQFARFISTIEVFDPFNSYWNILRDSRAEPVEGQGAPPMELSVARAFHTATLIDNNRIMVTGGFCDLSGSLSVTNAVDIIDVVAGTIETLTPEFEDLRLARAMHTAHWLGRKLYVVGGVDGYDLPRYLDLVEVYDPTRGFFEDALDPENPSLDLTLAIGRGLHSGTTLPDGILVTGGRTNQGVTNTVEFLEHRNGELHRYFARDAWPTMSTPRFGHQALLLDRDYSTGNVTDRYLVVAGGFTQVGEGRILGGAEPTGSLEFFHTWNLAFIPDMEAQLSTPRAHFGMVESSITRDLLFMGGIDSAGNAITTIERVFRNQEGGLCSACVNPAEPCPTDVNRCASGPMVINFAGRLKNARAYAPAVSLITHNVMIVSGWDGTNSTASCGGTVVTAGCTSEIANLGDLYYLGGLY